MNEPPLNREWVSFHLQEAMEETRTTLADLAEDAEYGFPEFSVAMSHLYHHVNTAWNSRSASERRVAECSQPDFYAWRQFPQDLDLV